MKTFIIFIIGMFGLNAYSEGVQPIIFAGLIAWAYYRMGHADGLKKGWRDALSSGWKIGNVVSRSYKAKFGVNR